MNKLILILLLLTSCNGQFLGTQLVKDHCYVNDNYNTVIKITKVLQHGAFMKIINRSASVIVSCGKETEQHEAYVSWDVLERRDRFLYEIDCEAYDKMRKE